jgi:hypothetical protein
MTEGAINGVPEETASSQRLAILLAMAGVVQLRRGDGAGLTPSVEGMALG